MAWRKWVSRRAGSCALSNFWPNHFRDRLHKEPELRWTSLDIEPLETRQLLNGLPVALPDPQYQTALNTQLVVSSGSGVLANDFDAEGSSLTASSQSNPSNGTLTAFNSNGSFTYNPNTGFQGIDSFTYRTSDGTGNSATVSVKIVVGNGFSARQNGEERVSDNPLHTGALTLVQPLTQGEALVYSSASLSAPIVAVDAFLATGTTIPNSITATLTFGGVTGSAVTFSTSGMSTGTVYRYAVQAASGTLSLATGMYDWSLELVANYTGSTLSRTYSGKQAFVNRSASEYGSGWWLAGLDQLVVSSAGGLLVKADGSSYWYAYNGSSYDAAPGDPAFAALTTISGGYRITDKWGNQSDFNSSGYLTSFKLKTNNVASYSYSYNGSNQLTQIADEFSRNIALAYSSGKISTVTDFTSDYSTLTVSSGNLTAVTAAIPASAISGYTAPQWQYGYTSNRITSVTPPGSSATSFSYDGFGLLATTTNPDSTSRTLYPTVGQGARANGGSGSVVALTSIDARVTNELSNTAHFSTDPFGNVTRYADYLGAVSTFEFDTNGLVFRVTEADPDGSGSQSSPITKFGYNASGDLLVIKYPDNTTTTATYDSALHRVLTETDVMGITTTYTYDSSAHLLTKTVADGGAWTYTYDSHGGVLSETSPDPDGTGSLTAIVVSFEYETTIYNRLKKITYADNSTVQYTYGPRGNVTSFTDELGHVTSNVWDPLNRLTQTTLPDPDGTGSKSSPVYNYEYDSNLQLKKVTDPLGNFTQYTYNNRNWVATVSPPDPDGSGSLSSPTVTYAYDALGQITSVTDPQYSSDVTFTYDANGRSTAVTGPLSGQTHSYEYDLLGRLISETDASGRTKTYEYNISNLLTRFEDHDPDGTGPKDGPVTTYTYGADGRVLTVTDPLGRVTTMEYLGTGPLTKIILPDPDGSGSATSPEINYGYDALGRHFLTTDAMGRETKFEYNKRDWVVKTTTPNPSGGEWSGGPESTYTYDAAGNLLSTTAPLSRTTSYAYDNLDRLVTLTLPDPDGTGSLTSPVWTYDYDAAGNLISDTNPLGGTTAYAYDNLYRQKQVTLPDPDGAGSQSSPVWSYAYGANTLLASVTDPLSHQTSYGYDGGGRTTSVTDPLGNVTSYTYDLLDRMTSATTPDPDGIGSPTASATSYGYDIYSRPTTITDALGGVTTRSYDLAGQLLSLADPTGNLTRWSYDRIGRMLIVTNALGDSESTAYDASGLVTSRTDRNGRTTTYTYDGAGRQTNEKWYTQTNAPYLVIATTQAGSSTTEEIQTVTAYNINDETSGTFHLAFNGETTKALAITSSAATVESALEELAAIDNVTVTKSGYVWTVRFTGNLTNTDVPLMQGDAKLPGNGTLAQTMTFTYDTASRMTSASDPAATYNYTFDKLDRVTSETQTIGGLTPKVQLDRTYDALGNVLTLAADFVQNGSVVAEDFINSYSYDGLNRLITLVQDNQSGGNAVADKRIEIAYNALSQKTSITRYQNVSGSYPSLKTAFTYDGANRIDTIAHRYYSSGSSSTLLNDYDLAYDNAGRITGVTSTADGNSALGYDKTNQVTSADHSGQSDEGYTYDANGNRTNSGYSTGTNNQTTSDGTYNYQYDKEGNRTRRTLISTGAYEQYTWDNRNRLTKIEFKTSGGTVTKWIAYSYDVFNRLVRRQYDADGSGSGAATNTYYAGYDGISPTLEFDAGTKSDVSHRYLWGAGFDELFADEQVSVVTSNGNTLWALVDHLGTIRDIADYDEGNPSFAITNHRVYDTFGRLQSETNSAVDLMFGYTGKAYDEEAQLNQYLNRWYDPRIGKWLSEDPMGFSAGDANLSRYVGNSASMLTDPLGLQSFGSNGEASVTSGSALQEEPPPSSSQESDPPIAKKTRRYVNPERPNGWYDLLTEFRPVTPKRFHSVIRGHRETVGDLVEIVSQKGIDQRGPADRIPGMPQDAIDTMESLAKLSVEYTAGAGFFASPAGGELGDKILLAVEKGGGRAGGAADDVVRSILRALPRGNTGRTGIVPNEEVLEELFFTLSKGGKIVENSGKGVLVELPTGTTVGYRPGSKSGGPAIEVIFSKTDQRRVHVSPWPPIE